MNQSAISIETDFTGLTRALDELSACVGADSKEMLRVEAGQLAWRIAQGIGPASASTARKTVEKNVKRILTVKPARENLKGIKQGSGDVQWLYSGPSFIAGMARSDNRLDASSPEAVKLYYAAKQAGRDRQNAWSAVGTRGHQSVQINNRIRVAKQVFAQVVKGIQANIGQAKASFAFATAQTTHKRIAGWISKHFPTQANGKAIFSTSGLANGNQPYVEIGSRARGVVSNPKMVRAIQSGLKQSTVIIAGKVKKLLNDYAYDFNNGRVFKPKAHGFDRN